MECQRFQKLVKNWYLQVQDESMAPARMVAFMEKHLVDCPVCRLDPLVREEVNRIIAIVQPATKTRKPPEAEAEEEEDIPDLGEGDDAVADSDEAEAEDADEEGEEVLDDDDEEV